MPKRKHHTPNKKKQKRYTEDYVRNLKRRIQFLEAQVNQVQTIPDVLNYDVLLEKLKPEIEAFVKDLVDEQIDDLHITR